MDSNRKAGILKFFGSSGSSSPVFRSASPRTPQSPTSLSLSPPTQATADQLFDEAIANELVALSGNDLLEEADLECYLPILDRFYEKYNTWDPDENPFQSHKQHPEAIIKVFMQTLFPFATELLSRELSRPGDRSAGETSVTLRLLRDLSIILRSKENREIIMQIAAKDTTHPLVAGVSRLCLAIDNWLYTWKEKEAAGQNQNVGSDSGPFVPKYIIQCIESLLRIIGYTVQPVFFLTKIWPNVKETATLLCSEQAKREWVQKGLYGIRSPLNDTLFTSIAIFYMDISIYFMNHVSLHYASSMEQDLRTYFKLLRESLVQFTCLTISCQDFRGYTNTFVETVAEHLNKCTSLLSNCPSSCREDAYEICQHSFHILCRLSMQGLPSVETKLAALVETQLVTFLRLELEKSYKALARQSTAFSQDDPSQLLLKLQLTVAQEPAHLAFTRALSFLKEGVQDPSFHLEVFTYSNIMSFEIVNMLSSPWMGSPQKGREQPLPTTPIISWQSMPNTILVASGILRALSSTAEPSSPERYLNCPIPQLMWIRCLSTALSICPEGEVGRMMSSGLWDILFSECFFFLPINWSGNKSAAARAHIDLKSMLLPVSSAEPPSQIGPLALRSDLAQVSIRMLSQIQSNVSDFVVLSCCHFVDGNTDSDVAFHLTMNFLTTFSRVPVLVNIFLTVLKRVLSYKSQVEAQEMRKQKSIGVLLKLSQTYFGANEPEVHETQQIWIEPIRNSIIELLSLSLLRSEKLRSLCEAGVSHFETIVQYMMSPATRKYFEELAVRTLFLCNDVDYAHRREIFATFCKMLTISSSYAEPLAKESIQFVLSIINKTILSERESQDWFCDGDIFGHISTILNSPYFPTITQEILRTVKLLTLSNKYCKDTFSLKVGYQYFGEVIVRAEGGLLSDETLQCFLEMINDAPPGSESTASVQLNYQPLLPALVKIASKAKDPKSLHKVFALYCEHSDTREFSRSQLCAAGVLDLLIEMIPTLLPTHIAYDRFTKLLSNLGSYSATVRQLKMLINLCRPLPNGKRPPWTPSIVKIFQHLSSKSQSRHLFDFHGPHVALQLPILENFPGSSGLTFASFLKYENSKNISSARPTLFSFLNKDKDGIEAYFQDGRLTYAVKDTRKGIQASYSFVYEFPTKILQFVCIVHESFTVPWTPDEVRLYVDGAQVEKGSCKYVSFGEPLNYSYVGNRSVLGGEAPFDGDEGNSFGLNGKLGSIYIFKDVLSSQSIKLIHELGPQYMGSFLPGEFELTPKLSKMLAETPLAPKLFLHYVSKATDGRIYYDLTTPTSADPLCGSRHALCHGMNSTMDRPFSDMISCLGGVQVFLPLLWNINKPLEKYETVQDDIYARVDHVAEVLRLLLFMFIENKIHQDDMCTSGSFAAVGFILRTLPPSAITTQTVMCLRDIWTKLPDIDYSKELLQNIIFNMRLWIYCDPDTQSELHNVWMETIGEDPQVFRKLFGVQYLLDVLRVFYWYSPEKYSFAIEPRLDPLTKVVIGGRPSIQILANLRHAILRRLTYTLSSSFTQFDGQALTCSLTIIEPRHRQEILELMNSILESSQGDQIASLLFKINTHIALLHIAYTTDVQVRVSALNTLACLASKYAAAGLLQTYAGLLFKCLEFTEITDAVYEVIYRLLTLSQPSLDASENHTIQCHQMLHVFVLLIEKMSSPMKLRALRDLNRLLSKTPSNRALATQESQWLGPFCRVALSESKPLAQDEGVDSKSGLTALCQSILQDLILESLLGDKEGYQFFETVLFHMSNADHIMDGAGRGRSMIVSLLFDIFQEISKLPESPTAFKIHQKNTDMQMNVANLVMITENIIYSGWFLNTPPGIALEPCHLGIEYSSSALWLKLNVASSTSNQGEIRLRRSEDGKWTDREIASHIVRLLDPLFFETKDPMISTEDATRLLHASGLRSSLLILLESGTSQPPYQNDVAHYIDCIRRVAEYLLKKSDRSDEQVPAQIVLILFMAISRAKQSGDASILPFVFSLLQFILPQFPALSKYSAPDVESFQKAEMEVLEGSKQNQGDKLAYLLSDESPTWADDVRTFVERIRVDLGAKQSLSLARRTSLSLPVLRVSAENHQMRLSSIKLRVQEQESQFTNTAADQVKQTAEVYNEIRDYDDQRLHLWNMEQTELNTHGMIRWREIYRELTSERGCWGQQTSEGQSYWKMEKSEDSLKCRRRFRKYFDYEGHHNVAINPSNTSPSESAAKGKGVRLTENMESIHSDLRGRNTSAGNQGASEGKAENERRVAVGVVYQTFCQWISPMRSIDGIFELTREHILFIPRNAEHTKDISFDDLIITEGFNRKIGKNGKIVRWKLRHLLEVHPRRYSLQASALEFFMEGNTNFFLNFPIGNREKVFQKIKSLRPAKLIDLELTFGLDRISKSNLTERWVRREISNFEYLMQLNIISGRSYNDLMQYPVFPWVIQDYESQVLDLEDERTFRDLSKPIGALNAQRLNHFKERYQTFDDPVIPKFLYGTHYSSAGIVLQYLVRLEPFTTWFLELQGGRFDHADRMFWSIPRTWDNCLNSTSDVKEVIPEFYYLPEFLVNQNKTDFGLRQSGAPVDDVMLPPWASSPTEFIRLNREALESDYVSQRLHLWIDLIFGCKQRGEESVKADNVFYYLTYEGAVDLDSLDDPILRQAYQDQISNFGQTPSQIFKTPHPRRESRMQIQRSYLLDNFMPLKNTIMAAQTKYSVNTRNISPFGISSLHVGVTTEILSGFSLDSVKTLIVITSDRKMTSAKFTTVSATGITGFLADLKTPTPRNFGVPFNSSIALSNCYAITPDARFIISAGHWDDSIKVHSIEHMKVVRSIPAHRSIVTCVALGEDGSLVTGSKDCTVQLRNIRKIQSFNQSKAHDRAIHLMSGHSDVISSVAVSDSLDTIVSASKDGTIQVHRLHRGDHHRTIVHPEGKAFHHIAMSCHGFIVGYSLDDLKLRLYTINAEAITVVDTAERIRAVAMSPDGRFVLTGGDSGNLVFRALHNMQTITKCKLNSTINCILPTKDAVFVGCVDGNVHAISFTKFA